MIAACGDAVSSGNRLYAPCASGKLFVRGSADSATGALQTAVFIGASEYAAAQAFYDATIFINTPLTVDTQGNVFFGFIATGANPAGLTSGLARIGANGIGSRVSAVAMANDPAISKAAMNCAPALSPDLATLYIAVNTPRVTGVVQTGYLVALDAANLSVRIRTPLFDPGVAGGFGWDDTASVVPASMVPSYIGPSGYLLMVKYNNYRGAGYGDGANRLAIIDPNVFQADAVSGLPVMREVLTIVGPTFEVGSSVAVKEWCINTAAVDPATNSVLANSEDGYLYRWNLTTNTFTQRIQLTSGIAQSYTPTVIGADGMVYAVNNAVLFSVSR
jgi:hypothetical protein